MPSAPSVSTASPLVRIEEVERVFTARSGESVQALAPTTLDIRDGEFLSLIGPSGCGKSTLLRILAGLDAPTRGRLDWRDGPPQSGGDIGYVFQDSVLLPWLSVVDNVRFPLDIFKVARAEAQARAEAIVELVGLADFKRALPKELSGGMRQRAAIARALVYRPRIVLMDEPFGALDLLTRDRLNDELLRIRGEIGATIVFVTHSIEEAVYLSDRVAVMSARPGRIRDVHAIDLAVPRTAEIKEHTDFYRWQARLRRELI